MGSGYRTFTAGEVLTASNVQDYLMDQSVMVFADSTARASGIGTANFEEGMVSYLEDTDTVEVYDGSAWASIAPASTSGLTLINTTSFSAVASQSINDVFSATYTNYKIIVNAKSSSANAVTFSFRFRVAGADDSTSNYRAVGIGRRGGSTTVSIDNPGTSTTLLELPALSGVHENLLQFEINNPFSAKTKGLTGTNFGVGGDGSTGNAVYVFGGGFFTTTSFTGFSLIPGSGTMTGSISTYGFNA
jgi:hypothetical protein